MGDPMTIAALRAQLAAINTRIAGGVREVRYNNRSTSFDLSVLQEERERIEAQLGALGASGPAPVVRRLLVTQRTKGL